MKPSEKQIMLLDAIKKGAGGGKTADLDEILENLEYKTTKQALHFSIRALIKEGLIEKLECQKREDDPTGWARRHIGITAKGCDVLRRFKRTPMDALNEIIL